MYTTSTSKDIRMKQIDEKFKAKGELDRKMHLLVRLICRKTVTKPNMAFS